MTATDDVEDLGSLEPTFAQAQTWWSKMRRQAAFTGVPGHPWNPAVLWNAGLLFCPIPRAYRPAGPRLDAPPRFSRELEGCETDALQMEFSFGAAFHFPDRLDNTGGEIAQELLEGRMPVIISRVTHEGLEWNCTVFSRLPDGRVAERGDEPLLTEAQWTVRNPTGTPLTAQFACHLNQPHVVLGYKVALAGKALPCLRALKWKAPLLCDDRDKARLAVVAGPEWRVTFDWTLPAEEAARAEESLAERGLHQDVMRFRAEVPAGGAASVRFIVPFFAVEPPVLQQAARTDFAQQLTLTRAYWTDEFHSGGRVRTPEPLLNDCFDAYLHHAMIATGRKPRSGHWILKTSPNNYEALWGAHASIAAFSMDLRGKHDWSRKVFETFLDNQGPVGGMLTDLFGANRKAESEGYSEHPGFLGNIMGHMAVLWAFYHGWTLWAIGRHARLTGDWPWLASHAGKLGLACEWIADQRKRTKRRDAAGVKALAYGLLPAANAFDWGFGHMFWSDAHTYRGLREMADCLQHISHPAAPRYLHEAEAYRQDIITAVTRARDLAPPAPLDDGAAIPYVPMSSEMLDYFRPDWTYVGCGPLNLAWAGVVPYDHELITQVLAFLQAGRPLGDWLEAEKKFQGWDWPASVPADEDFLEATRPQSGRAFHWRHKITYEPGWMPQAFTFLGRDDMPAFLEFLYSQLAHGGQHVEVRSPIEQRDGVPWCQPGDATLLWLMRDMLVREEKDELLLAASCPRAWLEDGQVIEIAELLTCFGKVSYRLESAVAQGLVRGTFRLAFTGKPAGIRLRLRHPRGLFPREVWINGKVTRQAGDEWITLPANCRKLEARY